MCVALSVAYNAASPPPKPNTDSDVDSEQSMSQPQASPKQDATALAEESKREIWDLRWIREPQQDRSARTRAQLLDATETILDQEGIEGLTITKVAREAGCSVGSLYHHFQDKQTIIYAVLDRVASELALTAEEGLELSRWDGVTLMGVLEGYLRYSLKRSRHLPGLMQAQRLLAIQDPNIASRLNAANERIRKLIFRLLRPRLKEIGHPNPKLAINTVMSTLRATLGQRAQSFATDAPTLEPRQSDESFVREMMKMTAAYLQIETTPSNQ